jgi:nucleoside-diphosphate-sugar epimerase
MRVCVTGSSGFIGQHLVRGLLAADCTVLGLDVRQPVETPAGFEFTLCDILDEPQLRQVLSEHAPEALVHLAARTDLDENADLSEYAANIDGVRNLVAAMRATPSIQRAVFTSSQLVCRVGYVPQHDQDYAATTVYGKSKVLTEQIVREANGGDTTWCLVRPTTVWGPGMSEHFQRFFRLIYQGLYFHIGDKPVYQPYGYIDNVVHQYMKLLTAPAGEMHGKTLYVSDYEPISLRVWTNGLQQAMAAPPIRSYPEWMARTAAKVGDGLEKLGLAGFPLTSFRLKNLITEYQFDMTETANLCGPLPCSMEQGIEATVAWLRSDQIIPEMHGR